MQTSVKLQEPFKYSVIPLIIGIFFVMAMICYLIYLKRGNKKLKLNSNEVKAIPEKNIKNIPIIKEKYLNQLNQIEYKYNNKMIEIRTAYQLISESIRLFIFEVTDITTQNYSLSEIKKINMPILYQLIEEYYEPEFARKSVGDFESSINKARRIISEWN